MKRRRCTGDQGAFLILFALSLLVVLTFVAFAVDLGQARFSKRSEQSTVDLAALDAGYFLSGRGVEEPKSQPRMACEAAVQSVQRNVNDFPPLTQSEIETQCSVFPSTADGCDATDSESVHISGGHYLLVVTYPAIHLDPAQFSGGVGLNDGEDPCERMAVTLGKTEGTSFAGVIGVEDLSTQATAVVRGSVLQTEGAVAALVLLERMGCSVLSTAGGGGNVNGVFVKKYDENRPGLIALDSAGQAPPCSVQTDNNSANSWVILAGSLPSGGPSVVAEAASEDVDGQILLYSLGVGGRAAREVPTGINVEPQPGKITSRSVADSKYNGVNRQVARLHEAARTALNLSPPADAIASAAECKGNIPEAKRNATTVYVNCSLFEPAAVIFPNAINVYVNGSVQIKNNNTLSLPKVQNFFVRGCDNACVSPVTYAIDISGPKGRLLVNTGEESIPALGPQDPVTKGIECSARKGPGNSGTVTETVKFATLGGSVGVAGLARLCQTTVYVGERNLGTHTRRSVTDKSQLPTYYTDVAKCSDKLPCPANDVATMSGVSFSGIADWTAPNQLPGKPSASDLVYEVHPFEDLALWAETSNDSQLKGQGVNTTQGVFFLPNSHFSFSGQGTQDQPLNAQFFARRLSLAGQGSLVMKPNPSDSIDIEALVGSIGLIR